VIPAVLNHGSDPFRFALVWAIGFECLSRPDFRAEQSVAAAWTDLSAWIRDEAPTSPPSTAPWMSAAVA
jgi:hypothetical protein